MVKLLLQINMKKLIIAAVVALSAITANAVPKQEDLWINIARSDEDGTVYHGLRDSGHFTNNDDGYPVYAITGRTVKDNSINGRMWYVLLEQCVAGQGYLVTTDTQGNFLFNTKFAIGLGTVASVIAETICNIAESHPETVAPAPAPAPTKKPTKKPAARSA